MPDPTSCKGGGVLPGLYATNYSDVSHTFRQEGENTARDVYHAGTIRSGGLSRVLHHPRKETTNIGDRSRLISPLRS